MKKTIFITILTLCVSCGNNNQKKTEAENQVVQDSEIIENQSQTTNGNETIVELGSDDKMAFDKKEIRVKAGQKITLNLRHTGKLPKTAMGHNFVLLKQGTDTYTFGMKAMQERDNQYIPKNTEEVIAHTDMIGGGEKTSVTFDAPPVGTYDFICSFPGHFNVMKGKFIVE